MSTIAEKFKFLRQEKNLTQQGLADILNCKKQNISNIESGHQKPTTELTKKLIEKLGLNANWLIANVGRPFNFNLDLEGDKIEIEYWKELSEELKNPKIVSCWFDREIIENVWGMSAEHLCIVPMVGDKMTHYWYPIYNNDILIVDTNQNYIMGNGVYFATSRNNTRFWIREMQILINNDVQVKGFAPSGDTTKVLSAETLKEADFKIIGKVIKNVSFRL